jgi:hypothetical protein
MSCRRGIGWALRVSACGLALSASAAAAAPAYDVVEGCPPRHTWTAALRERLPEALRERVATVDFSVRIARAGAGAYDGELGSVSAPATAPRRVRGRSCAEVAEALTLIAALELQRAPAPPAPQPNPAEAPRETGAQGPEDTSGARRDAMVDIGATALVWLQPALGPEPLARNFGIGATLAFRSERWQPWLLLALSWGRGEPVNVRRGGATARFERRLAHALGCPLRFPHATPVAVRPCLGVDVGQLRGEGTGLSGKTQSSSIVASLGPALRLEWSVVEQLELGAQLGGVVNVARPRFYFLPEVTAFEVPAFGAQGSVSASLVF